MTNQLLTLFLCAVAALLGTGGAQAQCGSGPLAVIVNKANSTESLSTAQLRRLALGDIDAWPDRKPVNLVARDSASEVFKCVLSTVVRMSDAEYRRYLMNAEFRGRDQVAIRNADSAATAAKIVASLPGGIAIIEVSALPAVQGIVKVLKIGGKAPGEPGYSL
jgi:ABC-type phosphate transport system substrate-binding protein